MILVLSGFPGTQMPDQPFFSFDKVIHFGLYGGLAGILIVGFKKQDRYKRLRLEAIKAALAFSIVYGIVIEIFQGTVFVARSIDLLDIAANIVGSFFGWIGFYLIYKYHKSWKNGN